MPNTVTIDVQARGEKALDSFRKSLISLAPAAAPVAAGVGAVAVQMGAAAVATAAFGAAVIPQAKAMSEAAKSGTALSESVYSLPPATQQAAKSFIKLKDSYKGWSDSLAGDTMPIVNKGLLTMNAILPQLTGMVKGASGQFDRLMTTIGGGVANGAFGSLMNQITDLSNNALKSFTDQVIHLSRAMSEGSADGPLQKFIDYAKTNGPAVKETLTNIAEAVLNLLQGAASAGPSMLTIVNALAKMVAALPPEFIGVLLKVYTGFKLISTIGSAMTVVTGAIANMGVALGGMVTASAAAGGGLVGLRAAFMSLSVGMRAALITTGIGAIIVALGMLSSMGEEAPPSIDGIASSIKRLGDTGKNSGEAARVFGKNFEDLGSSLQRATDPKGLDKFQQSIVSFFGTDSTPVKKAKDDIDAYDKALASLVKSGNAKEAAEGLKATIKSLEAQGKDTSKFKDQLNDYKDALSDQAYEAKMAADAQGIYGKSISDATSQINDQATASQALFEAFQALNNLNRQALGGQIGMEAAIDAAQAGAKKYGDVLHMTNGELDLNGKNAQDAATLISNLAAKTDEYGQAATASGASQEKVNGIYQHGREHLMEVAQQLGLTKTEAAGLAEQYLKTPETVTTTFELKKADAQHDLEIFNDKIKNSPKSHSVTLNALSAAGEQILEAFGYKVKRLPNGKVTVTASTGKALSGIGNVQSAVNSLHGKTITVMINGVKTGVDPAQYYSQGPHKGGGLLRRAGGGPVQYLGDGGYIQGPGTGTSDSIYGTFASGSDSLVSNTEYVVKASAVRKYGVKLFDALNSERLPATKLAKGGLSQSAKDARNSLSGSFGISSFGRTAGYKRTPFEHNLAVPTDINALVSSLNEAAGNIKKAFSGKTETKLLSQLNKAGRSLIAYDKKLNDVNKSLDKARDSLSDLKSSASQLKDSVKSGLIGEANITKAAGSSDSQVTINTLLGTMGASAANTKQFSKMLADLKKKGVSGDLVEQIASAGIGGGGMETAAALLGGSKDDIKRINDYQKQIGKAAGDAGQTASDAMYAAGIKAAEGLVKGLEKKKKSIEDAMLSIARSMEKAIKKALGIKSPSKVMEDVGHYTAEGFAVGMKKNKSVRPAWASMLNVPRTARTGGQGGYDAQPMVLEIHSGGSKMDDLVVEIVRKSVRVKGGGNVQRHLGN